MKTTSKTSQGQGTPRNRWLFLMIGTGMLSMASLIAYSQTPSSLLAQVGSTSGRTRSRVAIPAGVPVAAMSSPPALIETAPNRLTIHATNASLRQTLQTIAEKTGMKITGVSGDEHVFGTFGPGNPRDVLITLLDGTAYNVIMKGTLENGAPRELLLSARSSGSAGSDHATPDPADAPGNEAEADDDSNDAPPPNAEPGLRPSILPADPPAAAPGQSPAPQLP